VRMPRFRIRTMMAVVLGVALLFWGGTEGRRLYRLSRYYSQRAAEDRQQEAAHLDTLHLLEADGFRAEEDGTYSEKLAQSLVIGFYERCVKRIPYHARQRQKYERAARYPWLPVEPDPPMPE
jgi:hypothetical protein